MKKGKKLVLYLIVIIAVIIISFLFLKIFRFDKKVNIEYPEVSESDINELYKLFPEKNLNSGTSFYIGSYLTSNNVSYSTISIVTYNYIERTNPFKFESITEEDINLVKTEHKLLYKINKDYFLETAKYIFGKTNYYIIDFKIDENKSATIRENYNYLYIYETNNKVDENIIYYKGLNSYTVENGNESIKIIEYFLKCNKTTKICYDDENSNPVVSSIKYSENLNINEYKDKIRKYEHKFSYKDGHYEYISTRQV